jgi:predicted phage terminase large subunit-like protein
VSDAPNHLIADGLAAIRGNFAKYIPAVHTLPEGGVAYPAPHHLLWASILMDDSLGNTLIIAPPDHAKTVVCGVMYPAWYVGNHPSRHVLYISASASLAEKQSVAVRDTIAHNPRYRALFPDVLPNKAKAWGQYQWIVQRPDVGDKDATFKAAGVGGDVIGRRCDLLILDDVNDEENVATDLQRQKVMNWVATTAMSRVVPGGRTICIMTRWHEEDLASWCRKAGFTVVHVPALSDTERVVATVKRYNPDTQGDDLVSEILVHENGPALWPERYSIAKLNQRRIELGPDNFAKMFQGIPVPRGGAIFKEEWWRHYGKDAALPHLSYIIQTADTAFSDKTTADWSVIQTWALGVDGRIYFLDEWRDRVAFPELKRAAYRQFAKWRPARLIVEERASGQSLIQELRTPEPGMPLLPVTPYKDMNRDKVTRANAVTGYFEAGIVRIPREDTHPWVTDWRSEMQYFPAGAKDDRVDAAVMAVAHLSKMLAPRLDDSFAEPQATIIGDVFARTF